MSRELQKSCQRIVDGLGLPRPFSLELLLKKIEKRRGRQLHILPLPPQFPPSGPCGLWIETKRNDFVFYDKDMTPFQQLYTKFHELAHMVCVDEEAGMATGSLDMSLLLPHLNPKHIQRVLGRDGYTDGEEAKAEMVASLMMDYSIRTADARPGVLGRLEDVLGARSQRPPR